MVGPKDHLRAVSSAELSVAMMVARTVVSKVALSVDWMVARKAGQKDAK